MSCQQRQSETQCQSNCTPEVNEQEPCYISNDCKYDYCVPPPPGYEPLPHSTSLVKKLGILDRFLVVWILLAMVVGVLIGYFVPSVQPAFATVQFGSVSVPIAVGLLVMMYPVLCKVQYEKLPSLLSHRSMWQQILISVVLNWIVGPIIMTALAWATLPDLPGFRTGVILVGLARCIAMVMIWNDLAGGDPNYCAILVAINAILQIALFSPYAILFINVVPGWFGSVDDSMHLTMWPVARAVLIYLGIPLLAGMLTRLVGCMIKGKRWYEQSFLPHIGPLALLGLIYTIVVMFANQGHSIIANIGSVCRVAVPLLIYFIIMFFATFFSCKALGIDYPLTVTQSFTAGSNNFELAISIAIATYGITSEQALAATIGPLIEVPVLLVLVYVAMYLQKKLAWKELKEEASVVC